MLEEKTGIGPGLMFVLLFSSIFGYGLANTPYLAARYIGSNGYLGVIFASLLSVLVIFVALKMGRKFPNKSMIEYLPIIFGNFLGKLLGVIYLLFLLSLGVWSLRFVTSYMSVYFLNRTPYSIVVLVVLLTTLYIAYKGIEVITRFAAFVFPLSIIFIVLSLIFSFQNFDFTQVRPVFFTDAAKLSSGTMNLFNMFFPLAVLFSIFQYQTEKQKGSSIVYGATALAAIILFFVVFGTLGVLGAKGTLHYSWPFLELVRMTQIPYIYQSFNLFFSITWFTQIIIGMSGLYFALAEGTHKLLNIMDYKWMSLILFPVIFIFGIIYRDEIIWRSLFDSYRIAGFIIMLALPVIIWLGVALRKKGELL